ncbi:WD40 repeat protein [Ceraceosorus bombacis]|uniref:WD40 repeat protein n=1 Tax=Ceraceosorus bombacis TaxID=401625 RepID=A0A0P1BRI4_9BASI|nr:WD40 repeat protein [Ceraceosorus bombacis]
MTTADSQLDASTASAGDLPALHRQGRPDTGRVVLPLSAPQTSLIESLSDALAAAGSTASTLLKQSKERAAALASALSKSQHALNLTSSDRQSSRAPEVQAMFDPEGQLDADELQSSLAALSGLGHGSQRITWARWEQFADQHILLLGYDTGGLQVYALTGEELEERLNIHGLLLPNEEPAGAVVTKLSSDPSIGALQAASARLVSGASYVAVGLGSVVHILDARTLKLERSVSSTADPAHSADLPFDLSDRIFAFATTEQSAHPPGIWRPDGAAGHPRTPAHRGGSQRGATSQSYLGPREAIQTGVQLTEHARKLGGTVLDAALTWGSARWSGASGSASRIDTTSSTSPRQSSLTSSGSSPRPSHPKLATSDRERERATLPRYKPRTAVKVIDLRSGRVLAHFTPRPQRSAADIALLRFSPTGHQILTADRRGHAASIFELRPSALHQQVADVWHCLSLFRGHTSARIVDAKWSSNSAYATLLSARGTAHVYALTPHQDGRRKGPLSYPLETFLDCTARTARARSLTKAVQQSAAAHEDANLPSDAWWTESMAHACPTMALVEPLTPSHEKLLSFMNPGQITDSSAEVFHLLIMDPRNIVLNAHRISISARKGTEPTTAGEAPGASALSTMMHRARSASTTVAGVRLSSDELGRNTSQASTRTPRSLSQPLPVMSGTCERLAAWLDLARKDDSDEVRSKHLGLLSHKRFGSAPMLAQAYSTVVGRAEVHSCEPRALARSPYLSRQISFRTYAIMAHDGPSTQPRYSDLQRSNTHRNAVRDQVLAENSSDDPIHGIDYNLASAIQVEQFTSGAAAAAEDVDSARSPTSRIPAFPQGQRARQPSWTSRATSGIGAIPIRAGAFAVAGSLDRARRSLIDAHNARRKIIAAEAKNSSTPSLSFEDVDSDLAIFADAVARAQRSSQTSTSGASRSYSFSSSRAAGAAGPESGESGGSADTPLTVHDEEDDSAYEDDGGSACWEAARGANEDEEGDTNGWDSFADQEFGGRGLKSPSRPAGDKYTSDSRARHTNLEPSHDNRQESRKEATGDYIGVFDEDLAIVGPVGASSSSSKSVGDASDFGEGSIPGSLPIAAQHLQYTRQQAARKQVALTQPSSLQVRSLGAQPGSLSEDPESDIALKHTSHASRSDQDSTLAQGSRLAPASSGGSRKTAKRRMKPASYE